MLAGLLAILGCAGAFWVGLHMFWLNTSVVLSSIGAAIVLCGLAWLAEAHSRSSSDEPNRPSAPVVEPAAVLAFVVPLVLLALLGVGVGVVPPRLFLVVWVGLLGGYVLQVAWMSWHRRWFTVAQMMVVAGPLGSITFVVVLLDSCQQLGFCL